MTNATTDRTASRKRELTADQQLAIEKLLLGKNDRETAELVGIHRVTVTRWRLHDQLFRAQFKRRKMEILSGSVNRLRALLPKALDCLAFHLTPRSDYCLKAAAQVFTLVKSGALNQDYYEESEIVADQYYEQVFDDDPNVDENEECPGSTAVAADQQVSEVTPAVPKEEPPQEKDKQTEEKVEPIQLSSEADFSVVPASASPVSQIEEPGKQTGEQSDQTSDPTQLSPSEDRQSLGDTEEQVTGATIDPNEVDSDYANNPFAYLTFRQLINDLKHVGKRY